MTIKFLNDKIIFSKGSNTYTLSETVTGFTFNGSIISSGLVVPWDFRADVRGYTSGGYFTPSLNYVNTIDSYPFASNTNASDVGDLVATNSRYWGSGNSSSSSGYASGGNNPPASVLSTNNIQKFPFAVNSNSTDIADLVNPLIGGNGVSSETEGYVCAGRTPSIPTTYNTISKFPFASDANATNTGAILTRSFIFGTSMSSSTHGYVSGGTVTNNTIEKFPFSSSTNATDVGDLTLGRYSQSGQSSDTHGYNSGGNASFTPQNTIDRFPFSTDTNATDVGDLSQPRRTLSDNGASSQVSGYTAGGENTPNPLQASNVIDKFPFATNANATDVGDLTQARRGTSGQQF